MNAAPPVVVPPKAPSSLFVLRRLFLTVFLRGHSGRGLTKAMAPTSLARKLGFTLLSNAIFGCIALILFVQSLFAMSVVLHAMTFFMVGMHVTTSAGEVLFNKEEADILMHRPILPRTSLQAKAWVFAEVSIYIALSLNLVGTIVVGVQGSWAYPFAHVFTTCAEAVFGTGCAVLAYQLCLRWFGRQRLDSVMTTVQVLFSVVLLAGSQILPRMVVSNRFSGASFFQHWWIWLAPPSWFAALDDAIVGSHAVSSWLWGLFGILATGFVVWLAVGKLASSYERGWQSLNESTEAKAKDKNQVSRLKAIAAAYPVKLWLQSPAERASFVLVSAYMLRDRDVKLRLYPSIAPFLVMPIMMLFINGDAARSGTILPFTITIAGSYLSMIPMTALSTLRFSQQWRATEIFRLAPIPGPWALQRGGQIAVSTFLVAPIVSLLCLFVLFSLGAESLWLVVPGIMLLPIYARAPGVLVHAVPLSIATEEAKAASRGVVFMLASFGTFALGGIAAAAWSFGLFGYILAVEAVCVAIAVFLMEKGLRGADWGAFE